MSMDIIYSRIPQRPPFLFVDKIIEQDGNKIITGLTLTGEEDFFKGHFPGNPVMPGVLIQEALFQSGALLMGSEAGGGLGVVTKVSSARFKSMIRPKDEMVMEVELVEKLANAYMFLGKTKVLGKTVAQVEFTCAKIEG